MDNILDKVVNRIYDSILPDMINLDAINEYSFIEKTSAIKAGNEIEKFFLLHIYLLNFHSVIYRFDSQGLYKDGFLEKIIATINGLPLDKRSHKINYNIPFPHNEKELYSDETNNWLIPWMTANLEMYLAKGRIEYLDEILLIQFEKIKSTFKCSNRCILKSRFINTYPDIIIDDSLIELKTNSNFKELKKHLRQILNQFIDFQIFSSFSNISYGNLGMQEKKLLAYPIEKVSLYYYRYNKLLSIDLNTMITKDEIFQLKNFRSKLNVPV